MEYPPSGRRKALIAARWTCSKPTERPELFETGGDLKQLGSLPNLEAAPYSEPM